MTLSSKSQSSDSRLLHGAEGLAGAVGKPSPFSAGAMVLITLHSPREKVWGLLLELNPAGASVSGLPLDSLDDYIRQLKAGERINASVVFFPMHRLERIELDRRNGEIPSLSEHFEKKTGMAPALFLRSSEVDG